jgi:hypothetical protein
MTYSRLVALLLRSRDFFAGSSWVPAWARMDGSICASGSALSRYSYLTIGAVLQPGAIAALAWRRQYEGTEDA